MVRKRKQRSLPVRAVIDACDIETQVERDRLQELEQEHEYLGVSKMTNGSSGTEYLRKKTDSYNSERGSVGTLCYNGKGSQSDVSSNLSSVKSLSLGNERNESNGIKTKRVFSSGNRSSSTNSPCDMKTKYNLPNCEWNTDEINDKKKNVTVDNGLSDFNGFQGEDVITNERYSESQLVCQLASLSDLSLLEEDADSFEIDGIAIVQNYLEQLGEANEGNYKSYGSSVQLGSKFAEPKKWTKLFDGDKNISLPESRRKSSLRKKSTDDSHKVSVSFQEPSGFNSRRVKSATTARTGDNQHQLVRPKTAIHRLKHQPESDVLHQTSERRVSSSTNISHDEYLHDPLHGDLKEKSELKRKSSAVSRVSEFSYSSRQRCPSATYDPELEKATTYIHGTNKQFSRANTSITPLKHGLKYLQMNYSENNIENNQSLIFLDLLKNSCNKNHIRYAEIRNIERRLELKRTNPLYSTTFYEQKQLKDPYRIKVKKVARTVAQKKKERKEKIKKMTDEVMGTFTPTCLTMKIADQKEVNDIGRNCRYLRCNPPTWLEDT